MRYGALALEEQLAVTSKLNDDHAELLTRHGNHGGRVRQ